MLSSSLQFKHCTATFNEHEWLNFSSELIKGENGSEIFGDVIAFYLMQEEMCQHSNVTSILKRHIKSIVDQRCNDENDGLDHSLTLTDLQPELLASISGFLTHKECCQFTQSCRISYISIHKFTSISSSLKANGHVIDKYLKNLLNIKYFNVLKPTNNAIFHTYRRKYNVLNSLTLNNNAFNDYEFDKVWVFNELKKIKFHSAQNKSTLSELYTDIGDKLLNLEELSISNDMFFCKLLLKTPNIKTLTLCHVTEVNNSQESIGYNNPTAFPHLTALNLNQTSSGIGSGLINVLQCNLSILTVDNFIDFSEIKFQNNGFKQLTKFQYNIRPDYNIDPKEGNNVITLIQKSDILQDFTIGCKVTGYNEFLMNVIMNTLSKTTLKTLTLVNMADLYGFRDCLRKMYGNNKCIRCMNISVTIRSCIPYNEANKAVIKSSLFLTSDLMISGRFEMCLVFDDKCDKIQLEKNVFTRNSKMNYTIQLKYKQSKTFVTISGRF